MNRGISTLAAAIIAAIAATAWAGDSATSGAETYATEGSGSQAMSDGWITTKVKAALVGNPTTKAYHINVTTTEGVVQLSGHVETSAERSEAERVARDIEGVREVDNDLEVEVGR
jgi:hyperosmotically inducible protein